MLLRNEGVALRTLVSPVLPPRVARLASRAALICSGVRRSGSESFTCSFLRETWRLCRFANLLSITHPDIHYYRLSIGCGSIPCVPELDRSSLMLVNRCFLGRLTSDKA